MAAVVLVPRLLGLKPDVPSYDRSYAEHETLEVPASVLIPTSPPLAPDQSFDLLIVDSECSIDREWNFATCSGFVKNLRPNSLQHVEVVVALLSDDGTPQTSESGPIDYDPLLPDQESPWTLYAPFNPMLTKYSISFRTASGQPLLSRKETP